MAVPQPSLSKTLPFWLANILWLIWPADLGMDCLAVETCGVHCVLKPATGNQRLLSSSHRAVHTTATFACTVLQRFPSRHQCLVWTSFHTYSIYTVKATEDPPQKTNKLWQTWWLVLQVSAWAWTWALPQSAWWSRFCLCCLWWTPTASPCGNWPSCLQTIKKQQSYIRSRSLHFDVSNIV